jgi:Flp pilus assembly protein TadB
MTSSDEHKQRNREIAKNEADRQATSAIRVSTWAIAIAILFGVIVVSVVWAWLNH